MESCDCSRLPAICSRCLAAKVEQLRGVAESRGHHAAERIAGALLGQRWSTSRDEALARARAVILDIEAHDEGVIAKLVEHVGKGAKARWRSERSRS